MEHASVSIRYRCSGLCRLVGPASSSLSEHRATWERFTDVVTDSASAVVPDAQITLCSTDIRYSVALSVSARNLFNTVDLAR
jgi:hypothetical protein